MNKFKQGDVVRHIKTCGLYIITGTPEKCRLEVNNQPAYAYVSCKDGIQWFRDYLEMEDGRFELCQDTEQFKFLSVRFQTDLVDDLAKQASQCNMDLNSYIELVLSGHLAQLNFPHPLSDKTILQFDESCYGHPKIHYNYNPSEALKETPIADPVAIIPIYSEKTKQYFVSPDLVKPWPVVVNGETVQTSAIVFNNVFDLLYLSQIESALTLKHSNVVKARTIQPNVRLDKIWFNIPLLNTIKEVSVYDAVPKCNFDFNPTISSIDRGTMYLNFTNVGVGFEIDVPIDGENRKYVVAVSMHLLGSIQLENGEVWVSAEPLKQSDIMHVRYPGEHGKILERDSNRDELYKVRSFLTDIAIIGYTLNAKRRNCI